jgi:hypothetical protein
MKNFYLLFAGLFSLCLQAQFSIDFDNMTPGNVSPQSPHIEMWPPNPLTDAQVTGQQFYSSPYSMQLRNNNTDDVVVNLGNKNSGLWVVTWQMYVTSGNTGYWNIQENESATPPQWNGEFHVGNTTSGSVGNITHTQTNSTVPFTHDTWFPVEITVNLDTHKISVMVDGNMLLQNINYEDNNGVTGNQLGSINFYSVDINNNYFVDDFELYEICEDPQIADTNTYPYICDGESSIISVSHNGQEVYWYDEEIGGNLLGNGSPFNTGPLYETTSFWVESQNETSAGVICSSVREEVVVVVLAPDVPVGDPNQVFQPGETLADLDVTGTNLTWYANSAGTVILPETTPLVHDTTYYVSQSEQTCESDLLAIHVAEALSNSEFDVQWITIYPNPVKNSLYLTAIDTIEQLEVFTLNGQKLKLDKISSHNNRKSIDFSDLETGVYLVKITTDKGLSVKRVIKK